MSPSTPPTLPPFPPSRLGAAPRTGIPLRKIILGLVLAGSILLFFMILFAALVAVIQEGSPRPHMPALAAMKHIVAHVLLHFQHHK